MLRKRISWTFNRTHHIQRFFFGFVAKIITRWKRSDSKLNKNLKKKKLLLKCGHIVHRTSLTPQHNGIKDWKTLTKVSLMWYIVSVHNCRCWKLYLFNFHVSFSLFLMTTNNLYVLVFASFKRTRFFTRIYFVY